MEVAHPLDILVNCSPYFSFMVLEMLSSTRLGDNALHTANSAYMRSAVLLIWKAGEESEE